MNGYEKFMQVRNYISDETIINELVHILSFDQLAELADDLNRNLDLDLDFNN